MSLSDCISSSSDLPNRAFRSDADRVRAFGRRGSLPRARLARELRSSCGPLLIGGGSRCSQIPEATFVMPRLSRRRGAPSHRIRRTLRATTSCFRSLYRSRARPHRAREAAVTADRIITIVEAPRICECSTSFNSSSSPDLPKEGDRRSECHRGPRTERLRLRRSCPGKREPNPTQSLLWRRHRLARAKQIDLAQMNLVSRIFSRFEEIPRAPAASLVPVTGVSGR